MPESFWTAVRERTDPVSLVALVGFVAVVTGVFGLSLRVALFMFGGGVAATLLDAAIAAGHVHRQTARAGIGLLVVAVGVTLSSEAGWSVPAVAFVAVPFGLGGGWTAVDALVSRWRGVVEPDGSVGGVPGVPALVANRGTVARVAAVLDAADTPLTPRQVARVAELRPDWTRRVLALLVALGDAERVDGGYLPTSAGTARSTGGLVVAGTVARLLQPARLLIGVAAGP